MVPYKCIKPFYKYTQNLEKERNRKKLKSNCCSIYKFAYSLNFLESVLTLTSLSFIGTFLHCYTAFEVLLSSFWVFWAN